MSVTRRFRAPLTACAVACLVAVTGCGSQSPEPTTDPPAKSTSQPGPDDEPGTEDGPGDEATTATSITMTRSGGIAGVNDTWRLTPADEFSEEAFELAARRPALEAEVAELDNEPICCDFFVYQIEVHYADGEVLRAQLDEDPQAELLQELVTAVSDSTRAQPDEPKS